MSLPLHPSGCLRQSMSAPLPFPKSVQPEEELDFTSTEEGVHDFHGAFAARALERVGTQTRRMRSRQSGRMARAVTLGGGGTTGGFAAGCFSQASVSVGFIAARSWCSDIGAHQSVPSLVRRTSIRRNVSSRSR